MKIKQNKFISQVGFYYEIVKQNLYTLYYSLLIYGNDFLININNFTLLVLTVKMSTISLIILVEFAQRVAYNFTHEFQSKLPH